MRNPRVVFASRAYLAIVAECYNHLSTETGGILLGKVDGSSWYVIEAIDPGYQKIHRSSAAFEYDETYVTHLANVRASLYSEGLDLLGLWHRHPGSFDQFSTTDDQTNSRFCQLNVARGAISGLVNVDPDFRLTLYHVSIPVLGRITYNRLDQVQIGDSHIPAHFLRLKTVEQFRGKQSTQTMTSSKRGGPGGWVEQKLSQTRGLLSHPPQPSEGSPQQQAVLEMLDFELDHYVERQTDYEYEMSMEDTVLRIDMTYVGEIRDYPRRIHCKFFVRDRQRWSEINGETQPYQQGAIKTFLDTFLLSSESQLHSTINSTTTHNSTQSAEDAEYASVLGLPAEGHSIEQIKKAYREKIKDYHPDGWEHEDNSQLLQAATVQLQRVIEAYNHFRQKYNF